MFPIPWNKAFRKKDGTVVNIEDAMSGGGSYTLPTASAETKGGVKIGDGLVMNGEVLSVSGGGSGGSIEYRAGETAEFSITANNSFYQDIVFSSPMPDTNYTAVASILRSGTSPRITVAIAPLVITNKTADGFRIVGFNNHSETLNFMKLEWIAIANK